MFSLHVCLHAISMQYSQRPEEGAGSVGTGVRDDCEHHMIGTEPESFGKAASALSLLSHPTEVLKY